MNDVSIIKAIKKCEYDFEVRAEKFLWHHPVLGFLDGSNLYCILNCGSNDLCHIKRKRTMIMHGKVVKDYR